MTTGRLMRNVLAGSVACGFAPYAAAQAINYQVLNSTSVPALGTAGLVVLSLLIIGGAAYFHRQARSQSTKLLSLMAGLIGLSMLAANRDVIQDAWAEIQPQFTAGNTVVQLPGEGTFEIINSSGASILITGFSGVGETCGTNVTQRFEKIHLAALDMPLSDLGIKVAVNNINGTLNICPHGAAGCPPAPTPPAIGCEIGSLVQPTLSCFVTVSCDGLSG